MTSYKYINTDDDFQSCVTSIEIENIKREPDDSDIILHVTGILNNYLTTSKGHSCKLPNWGNHFIFCSKNTEYVMNISSSGKLTKYKTYVDGYTVNIIKEPLIRGIGNIIISVNENICSREMPTYNGFFKGYTMKTNPVFNNSFASGNNILFNNVIQLWKTGANKYSLDYKYENQQFYITDNIAFALATALIHDNR